jgi:hypothetical protein
MVRTGQPEGGRVVVGVTAGAEVVEGTVVLLPGGGGSEVVGAALRGE